MAKVTYIDPIEHLSGRICRHSKTIYAHRNDSGTNFTSRLCNPSKANPTETMLNCRIAFKNTTVKVKSVLNDPIQYAAAKEAFVLQTKYKTIRGFIFAQNYEAL